MRRPGSVRTAGRRDTEFRGYHVLMTHRVQEILLVASAYDSYMLEEDGRFTDRISGEYIELKLSGAPSIHKMRTARDALVMLEERPIDLVVTTGHVADMPHMEMVKRIKDRDSELPVVFLSFDKREAALVAASQADLPIDHVFLWSGDPRILLAIVKTVEDRWNISADTRRGMVRLILVVEDSPSFYSSYLPILYTEVLEQTRRLMAERLNEVDRIARMRARPKVLLARTYEEAIDLYRRYSTFVLGVITDMRFPRRGKQDPQAGLDLIRLMKADREDLPVMLQTAEGTLAQDVTELGISLADKRSPDLLGELRAFMARHLGFGPFVFRDSHEQELDHADDLRQMLACLDRVPDESIQFHAMRNDFSNWFMARSEFVIANELRPRHISDFGSLGDVRAYLQRVLTESLEEEQRGRITEFTRDDLHLSRDFTRLGAGSLGGKARGIAFMGAMLATSTIHDRHPEIRIFAPRSTVICTSAFEGFVRRHDLRERSLAASSDREIDEMFLSHPLGDALMEDLRSLLVGIRYPLAVRSSSLLEDSRFQPFAGVYSTYLLPNSHESLDRRVEQLATAIRLVFASTYRKHARDYLEMTSQRLEEERMAIVIQRLVGSAYGNRFYPDFAGVARSHNAYPIDYMRPEDGIVTVALGLGRTVVEGKNALHFVPAYPKVPISMSTPEQAIESSQSSFYALDLNPEVDFRGGDETMNLLELGLEVAEADGTLEYLGATYVPEAGRVYDTLKRQGVRLVNFAGILKYEHFPLAETLRELLAEVETAVGTPVEIEFAGCMEGRKGRPELAVLQIRPIVTDAITREVQLEPKATGEHVILQGRALGSGVRSGICDIIYVSPDRYDRTATPDMARAIGRLNQVLVRTGAESLIIAPGRWGSADRFLGIPVAWGDISSARALVEIAMPGYVVDPSQGSHFFHNITSLQLGYFAVNLCSQKDTLDLDWLESLPALHEDRFVRHVRLPDRIEVRIDSKLGRGVVMRMDSEECPA